MRLVTVVGARPQFVKAAVVSRQLRPAHDELLVHTGQHYDDAMSAAFFRDLDLPAADVNLGVGSGPHGATTAAMLGGLEPIMLEREPDGVLVYGDTNSTLAGALVASKVVFRSGRRPWLAHVEAGLRSFNRAMPEERNRVVTDHLSDLLLAPTPVAMGHLAREGLADRARMVGDVMVDAFEWAAGLGDGHLPPAAASVGEYVLLTLHRAENTDDPARLASIVAGLAVGMPVVFPVHPRTRGALERAGRALPPNVMAIDPVGYLEMVALEARALLVATDSGGVQKEAYLAGVPCLTLRSETEWTETVAAGWNRVAGDDPGALAAALADPEFMRRDRPRPALYGDGHAAARIVDAMDEHQRGTARDRQLSEVAGA